MTNALTATKTPQLSSQGVPDVILVLNKQEKYEKTRTEQKKRRNKKEKKKKRTHKQRHMHTLTHKQRHTHKQKGTCSYTKSILYHCRKNGIQEKMICKTQKNKSSTRQSSIVSPGSSKMTPNVLKVNSRVPQTQDKSHWPIRNATWVMFSPPVHQRLQEPNYHLWGRRQRRSLQIIWIECMLGELRLGRLGEPLGGDWGNPRAWFACTASLRHWVRLKNHLSKTSQGQRAWAQSVKNNWLVM